MSSVALYVIYFLNKLFIYLSKYVDRLFILQTSLDKIDLSKHPHSPAQNNWTWTIYRFMGGCRGYFRDPWLALNFLREMWLLLFNPRELWFVDYRDPWFHNYFPRYLWKRPHFLRENDEKFWKMSVFLNDLQRKMRKMLNGDGIFSV